MRGALLISGFRRCVPSRRFAVVCPSFWDWPRGMLRWKRTIYKTRRNTVGVIHV